MVQSIFKHHFLANIVLAGLALWLSSTPASAQKIEPGKQIFDRGCAVCHGSLAQGNQALGGPALAGQHKGYLIRQLAHFSQGVRGSDKADRYGQQMAAMVTLVKDPIAQANVAAYLASLDKPSTSVTEQKTGNGSELGYKVYQASCGACHGADANGNERLNSPSLSSLDSAYLSRQYASFVAGTRGSHPSDKLGRQMKMIAATVTDQAKIEAVIAYITSLKD